MKVRGLLSWTLIASAFSCAIKSAGPTADGAGAPTTDGGIEASGRGSDAAGTSGVGHVIYAQSIGGGRRGYFRIEARADAPPEALDLGFDAMEGSADPSNTRFDTRFGASLNGEWYVAESHRFGCSDECLVVMRADGTIHERVLIGGEEQVVHNTRPAISNDGQTVVFPAQDNTNEPLAIARKAGGSWQLVRAVETRPGATHQYRPVFSRDQTHILFECSDSDNDTNGHSICRVSADGTNLETLWPPATNPMPALVDFLSVTEAPTGDLVFEANDGTERIFKMAQGASATPTIINAAHTNDSSPCVLPDGRIASLWIRSGPHELKIMNADGQGPVNPAPGVDVEDVGLACTP